MFAHSAGYFLFSFYFLLKYDSSNRVTTFIFDLLPTQLSNTRATYLQTDFTKYGAFLLKSIKKQNEKSLRLSCNMLKIIGKRCCLNVAQQKVSRPKKYEEENWSVTLIHTARNLTQNRENTTYFSCITVKKITYFRRHLFKVFEMINVIFVFCDISLFTVVFS